MTVFGRPPAHHGSHEPGGSDPISLGLNDLADVNAPAPADDNSLTWDAATGRWIPEAVAAAAIVPATFVIAAVDSEDTTRADSVCDGTADEVQINAAIAALPATGGSVFLLEGTYNLAASIIPASNTAIIGTGFGTKLISGAGIEVFNGGGRTKVIIANLQVDSAKAIDFVRGVYSNSRFKNLWLKTAVAADGFALLAGSSNNVVSQCYLECGGAGATRGLYGTLSDSIIIGNVLSGWYNGINSSGDDSIFANNKILSNQSATTFIVSGDRNILTGNHFHRGGTISGDNNILTGNKYAAADGITNTGAGNQIAHNYGV